jgi:hypothetical protein
MQLDDPRDGPGADDPRDGPGAAVLELEDPRTMRFGLLSPRGERALAGPATTMNPDGPEAAPPPRYLSVVALLDICRD